MRRWEDNIKSDLKDRVREGVNSIHLDQGRSKYQTVSNTVRIFTFQKKWGKFLYRLRIIIFFWRTFLGQAFWLVTCI
jgi:hypothetical protein